MAARHRANFSRLVVAGLIACAACSSSDDEPAGTPTEDVGEDAGADTLPPPPPSEPGRHDVAVLETRRIVPSAGLPPEAPPLDSNNNLDVIRFGGRVYLAWRTAPDHFASTETRIVLVSSDDERTWRFEKTFAVGSDLREPRFLALGDNLVLYVSVLGTSSLKFEPKGARHSRRSADGTWSELAPVMRELPGGAGPEAMSDDLIWRTKTERGKAYMTMYRGGGHIYAFDGEPVTVHFMTTDDGTTWRGVDPARPIVASGGGSESDFTIADDGTLHAIIRVEAVDQAGLGSRICHAPANDLASWTCKLDPKKYDSPLVFWHDGEAYLVARRHVSETGRFDLGEPAENGAETVLKYQIDYRRRPKRCALWRFVPSEDRIAYLIDLPSRGDTCFPARIEGTSPTEVVIYDYSSDIDGPELTWAEGQASPTFIYRHVLRFTPR